MGVLRFVATDSTGGNVMRDLFRLILAAIFLFGSSAASAADLEKGKALVKAKGCQHCHGLSGNTGEETDPPVPKLAGQPKAYLIKAMKDYRSEARLMETMNTLMKPRSDAEIELLAEYFSAQKRY